MTITALPTPPTRSDPATFAARGDAFMTALPTFATEANALQVDVNAKQVLVDAAAASIVADAAQTELDRIQTGADRVQTGLDRAASTATINTIAASAAAANASAGEASGAAASALAVYSTAEAMAAALATAQAQASAAAGSALSASSVLQQDLSAVSAALHRSPNAVTAMFVYDTSKDSDGGAWTERCQHTSWYNEALAGKWLGPVASEAAARAVSGATTSDYYQLTTDGKFYKLNDTSGVVEVFRGNKAKFPKLAGIVAEAANVTIYDLTEAGRPMWMRFANTAGYTITGNVATLTALNGTVAVGSPSGLFELSLPKDTSTQRNVTSYYARNSNIAGRNAVATFSDLGVAFKVVNSTINAVAMTILPDAPVDPVTGLKVPTIAVATSGGVSVIKHNRMVVNKAYEPAVIYRMALDGTTVYTSGGSPDSYWGSASWDFMSGAVVNLGGNQPTIPAFDWGGGNTYGHKVKLKRGELLGVRGTAGAVNQGDRLVLLKDTKNSTTKGSVAYFANTYATGHLAGDIRRAYLADSVVESVTGEELVTNGGFDTDTTGWSIFGQDKPGDVTWENGYVKFLADNISDSGNHNTIQQTITTVVGKRYNVSFFIDKGTMTSGFTGNVTINGTEVLGWGQPGLTGIRQVSFVATSSSTILRISGISFNSTGEVRVDNVSVRESVADRSYKAQAASITGTLTKSQVASAAQLVAYSGFSDSNYLREPYSADLDFGTGEWSVGAWVNVPASALTSNYQVYGDDLLAGAGAFTSSTGWSGLSAECTIAGGSLTKTGSSTHYVSYPLPALSLGEVLQVTFDVASVIPAIGIGIRIGHAPGWNASNSIVATGTQYRIFTAFYVGAGNVIGFDFPGPAAGVIQNVTVRRVKPLALFSRRHSSGAYVELVSPGPNYVQATAFDGTTTRTVTYPAFTGTSSNGVLPKDVWLSARATYKAGKLAICVNGVEVASTNGAPLLTLNNADAVLTIGNSYALDAPFPGSIALLKISATVPTVEQELWMYEQEKHLFRDGAQCLLPDANAISDLTYDDATDKWIAVSSANESEWSGLVRTSTKAVPSGAYSKVSATSGVKMYGRTTTSPGVDIELPAYGLREQVLKRDQRQDEAMFDFLGGFTATTNITAGTSYNLTSVAASLYPVSYVGAVISGSGIPASTSVVGVSGTTIYMSAAATIAASAVQISFTDFILPVGYEAGTVYVDGVMKYEGATRDFTRLFDGFKETIRFGVAPAYNAKVQIQSARSAA